ncbi:MAG TPA: hypothetical protein VGS97_06620 [Actinocrinis sp.]|uniref:hypothetical protein n=1 Tax=Actinocrinis sp. TaxID=1920516 RepID=UPI002DDCFD2F|nr:hypothetical protein [Actinocrinis sp.]HEV2343745.1 hypothetical protein [Actinocrinis sp.]
MSRETEVCIFIELRAGEGDVTRQELVADRLTVVAGDLVAWDRDEVVLRRPVSDVLSIGFAPEKNRYVASMRHKRGRASTRWTTADETRMTELDEAGESVEEIARLLERQAGAIRARLAKRRRTQTRHPDAIEVHDQIVGAD